MLHAQTSAKPFVLHWSEMDGICDKEVNTAMEDRHGLLWVGTSNGLCRFNGADFEVFRSGGKLQETLQGDMVISVFEASDGKIWVGTDGGGLSIFDNKTQRFQTLRQDLKQPENGLLENRVYSFLEDRNQQSIFYWLSCHW